MPLIYSKFASDEDWQELLHDIVSEIPQRLAVIEAAIANDDVDVLRILVHQLKGACGSYGFDAITPLACRLEQALDRHLELSGCQQELAEFRTALGNLTNVPTPTSNIV